MANKDRRYRKTEEWICNAMISLLAKRDVADIDPNILAKEADINVSTFYLHYSSIDAVLSMLEDQAAVLLNTVIPYISFLGGRNFPSEFGKLIFSYKEHFNAVLSGNPARFHEKTTSLFAPYFSVHKVSKGKKVSNTKYLRFTVFIDGILLISKQYISYSGRLSLDRYINEIDEFMKSSFFKGILL